MRAIYNPTRMVVIKNTDKKLVVKLNSCCPQCDIPGFGLTHSKKGLECSFCGSPTNSTLSYLYICQNCNFTKEEMYPHKKKAQDSTYCNYCNP